MFPETNTAFLSSLSNFLVFEKPRSEISTIFFNATEKINPRTYRGQWLTNPQPQPPPLPPSLWRFCYIYIYIYINFFFFFSVDDKTAAPDSFSNGLFFPTNSCSSTSFNNRSKAGGWNDAKCLFMLFYMSSKKNPFIAVLTWFLILGKIQDGDHCWWRHRPPSSRHHS